MGGTPLRCKCGQAISQENIVRRVCHSDGDLGVQALDAEWRSDLEAAASREPTPEEERVRDHRLSQMNGGEGPARRIYFKFRCPRCKKWSEKIDRDDAPPPSD